jgi:phage-related protein
MLHTRFVLRPVVWLGSEIKSPPFSTEARIEAGALLREIQNGGSLALPDSRPMPEAGAGCHELRVSDSERSWRILYCIDPDAIIVMHIFVKKTPRTPRSVIALCRKRLRAYRQATLEEGEHS